MRLEMSRPGTTRILGPLTTLNHETYPFHKGPDFDIFTTYLGHFEKKNAFFSKIFEAIKLKICRYVKN